MGGDGESIRSRDTAEIDSTEIDSSVSKKPKIEETENKAKAETEAKAETDTPSEVVRKPLRDGSFSDDPEIARQRDLFYKQINESQGFDVDWDSFDCAFNVQKFEWVPYLDEELSSEEVLKLLIQEAIKEHDELYETKLEFVKYVSANITSCKGFMFYITFLAKDLNSSNKEPKSYQAKVVRFCSDIRVIMVRVKPTK